MMKNPTSESRPGWDLNRLVASTWTDLESDLRIHAITRWPSFPTITGYRVANPYGEYLTVHGDWIDECHALGGDEVDRAKCIFETFDDAKAALDCSKEP